MKTYVILFFAFLALLNRGYPQEDTGARLVERLVNLPHGVVWETGRETKADIDRVLNNIEGYQAELGSYIEAALITGADDGTAVRRAQNAIYLLANAQDVNGITYLENKYDLVVNSVSEMDSSLAKINQEARFGSEAIALRRQQNNAIVLQRHILDCYREKGSPLLQSRVLSRFTDMDYSTQLVALKYLAEVPSANADFERRKYDELGRIYRDKTQFLFESEILKAILGRQ